MWRVSSGNGRIARVAVWVNCQLRVAKIENRNTLGKVIHKSFGILIGVGAITELLGCPWDEAN
jgi:hypothetical protein